jgi:hypothetical protein
MMKFVWPDFELNVKQKHWSDQRIQTRFQLKNEFNPARNFYLLKNKRLREKRRIALRRKGLRQRESSRNCTTMQFVWPYFELNGKPKHWPGWKIPKLKIIKEGALVSKWEV